jgi:hypothetical protein
MHTDERRIDHMSRALTGVCVCGFGDVDEAGLALR